MPRNRLSAVLALALLLSAGRSLSTASLAGAAEGALERSGVLGRPVVTPIEAAGPFYPAEATSTMLNGSLESCRLTGEVRLGDAKRDHMGLRTRSKHRDLLAGRLRR